MWAYKVIRLSEQPRTLHSGKWAGLVLDSCSWEWWPYVSLATGLVFWLRSFICGNTCLRSEGWCCKFKITPLLSVRQLQLARGPLSHWTFPFRLRVTMLRKRGRILSSHSKQNCLDTPYEVFFNCLCRVAHHWARLLVRLCANTCVCSEERYFCLCASVSSILCLAHPLIS